MKVSNKVLKLISTNADLRFKVALSLGITEQAVNGLIKRNSSNLTKIAAIRTLERETGLTEDKILAPVKATA